MIASHIPARIDVEEDKLGGKPCIRGLRISVQDVLGYLASGMSEVEILEDFPDLEKDDFQAVYKFASRYHRASLRRMKILVDENLPLRLATQFKDLFPEIQHVKSSALGRKSDTDVWRFA